MILSFKLFNTHLEISLLGITLPHVNFLHLLHLLSAWNLVVIERTNWIFFQRIYIIQVQYLTLNIGFSKIITIIVIVMLYYII